MCLFYIIMVDTHNSPLKLDFQKYSKKEQKQKQNYFREPSFPYSVV